MIGKYNFVIISDLTVLNSSNGSSQGMWTGVYVSIGGDNG